MDVQGEDTESRRLSSVLGLASRVDRFQRPARPYSLNGNHRHTPTIGVNCLTLVYTYKNNIGLARAAVRKHLTQYDAIVEAYQDSKKLPFRKASRAIHACSTFLPESLLSASLTAAFLPWAADG